MTLRDYKLALNELQKQTDRALDALCDAIRAEYVVPYCDRHGYRFTAGMGSWSFTRSNGPEYRQHIGSWNDELLPKALRTVLQLDHFTSNNDLGSMMQDYTPPNWKGD